MTVDWTKRKPARSRAEVPPPVLSRLNAGEIETLNLVEALAIDLSALVGQILGQESAGVVASASSYLERMRAGGRELLRLDAVAMAQAHASDTLRGMAAYAVGYDVRLDLEGKLKAVRPLAADGHFGVREWAWMGVRDAIIAEPHQAVKLLCPWTLDEDANIRRFACEATRPRGVWCAHCGVFKQSPELGLPILEPLKTDPTKYVQDSVANWLNDAAKTSPKWTREVTDRWLDESDSIATQRIVKRARRNLAS